MADNLVQINYPDFKQFVADGKIIIDFWAPWCQPCKTQEKIILELLKSSKSFVLGKINLDDNRVLAKELGVSEIPTLLFYKDGNEIHRLRGLQDRKKISDTIDKYF
jgi:thioredoxin 1